MNVLTRPFFSRATIAGCLIATLSVAVWAANDQTPPVRFSRTTIDMGIVVSDINAAITFYRDVIGFQEILQFDVSADLATTVGLTDNRPIHIHAMALGKEPSATKIKLMQIEGEPGKKVDHGHIHSSLGMSYITIFVEDLRVAIEHAKKHGVEPVAQGPVPIPGDLHLVLVRDPDGNFLELIGPLK